MENKKLFSKAVSRTKIVFSNDNEEEEKIVLTISCDTHRKVRQEVLEEIEQQLNQITVRSYSKQ